MFGPMRDGKMCCNEIHIDCRNVMPGRMDQVGDVSREVPGSERDGALITFADGSCH